MFKMLGIIMIIGSTVSFGIFSKSAYIQRVKSLSQMIDAINIMQRELKFNHINIESLCKKLEKDIKHPLGIIFKKLNKIIEINDNLSIEHKWVKTFGKYGEFIGFLENDLEIIKNIATVLGKFDIDEQIKALEYYKISLGVNLTDAKIRLSKEGNITKTLAVSVGLVLVIILI